ncbi:hypothetical protein ACV3R5_16375 [Clostridium perfringens]|uniref:hypothetical protein n=1 Tax=Clostridium perfringens TaxID=1502 RepID=UPI0029023BA0|nr:hypothetical protein [Clostridium perfringens]MDK0981157.1 hypothetical protein [Clostridium perfringens]MDU3020319.1 hypothetical protein [Clostridium perfringens]
MYNLKRIESKEVKIAKKCASKIKDNTKDYLLICYDENYETILNYINVIDFNYTVSIKEINKIKCIKWDTGKTEIKNLFDIIPSWKYLLDLNEKYNDINFSSIFLDNIVKNNLKEFILTIYLTPTKINTNFQYTDENILKEFIINDVEDKIFRAFNYKLNSSQINIDLSGIN